MCPRVLPALLCAAAAATTSHVVDNFTSTEGMFTLTSQVPPVSTTEVMMRRGPTRRSSHSTMGGPDELSRFMSYGLGQEKQYHFFYDGVEYGVPGDWLGHGGDSFGFASLAMGSDQHNASFAAVANTSNLAEINTAALKVYNEDLVARDAVTEAPTTAQTFEPTAAPESDAADRVALGAVAVTLLALVA